MKHFLLFVCLFTAARIGHADERLKGIACRSVHLGYPAEESVAFYNEATVQASAEGTYFMVCGFRMGYFGLQELANGKKVVLFSVWEPGKQNNPNATPEERRVRLLKQGDAVRVKRFGGEGTGGQSFFDFDWKLGETYKFLVRAAPDGERTAYAGYLYLPKRKEWKHLVTFSTLAGGKMLRGCYSFVEDFRRNRISTTKVRKAAFGNGWVQDGKGNWHPLRRARFTADANPVTNIDGGLADERYFLATGGETENTHTKLRGMIEAKPESFERPQGLPDGPLK